MIYRKEDYRKTKSAQDSGMQRISVEDAGVFGEDIYAARVSEAMQQVYDRYYLWIRLTRKEYDGFPGNLETIRSLAEDRSRILLTYGSWTADIQSFDSELPGPAPTGTGQSGK